mgnify:CR=1 FL=1
MEIEFLQKECPELFNCSSLLYVGAWPQKWTSFLDLFELGSWKGSCSVLELHPDNAQALRDMNAFPVIEGDLKDIEQLVGEKSFDVIFWEDGPEHIHEKDFDSVIPQMQRVAKKYIIMEAPEGIRDHDPHTPNLLDRQYTGIEKDTFDKYGIDSFLVGSPKHPEGWHRVVSIGTIEE